jgi:hypothetical protein
VFAARYTDLLGVNDIGVVYLRISAALSGPMNTCMVRYDRATGLMALRDDAGTWLPGAIPGGAGIQQNGQCAIHAASSSVASTGNTLIFNASLSFTPAYAGAKNVYLYAATVGGAVTDWQQRGTWTVP